MPQPLAYNDEELVEIRCSACGVHFGMPLFLQREHKKHGSTFYCVNGHARVYAESDVDVLKRQLEEEKKRYQSTLSRLNDAQRAAEKAATELKRAKKRAAAGVCPCCNRTFVALGRHMKTKHPEYVT